MTKQGTRKLHLQNYELTWASLLSDVAHSSISLQSPKAKHSTLTARLNTHLHGHPISYSLDPIPTFAPHSQHPVQTLGDSS